MADRSRLIKDFLELTAIDSVSFHERKFADALVLKLKELGLEPSLDETGRLTGSDSGNVFVRWQGEEDLTPVLFSAHMDTVEPGIGKKAVADEGNGVIKSDGNTVLGADDVAGIVEIIEAVRIVKESGRKHRSAEFLFPVAEEVYTKGSTAFDYSKLRSKEAYCLDLSGHVGAAAVKAPTLISFSVTVHGKASHAGFAPENGVNAIAVAAKAIAEIRQGHVDEDSTLNIGTIKGGIVTNIVPENVKVEGEIRSFRHERALELLEETKQAFESAAEENSNAGKAQIDFIYEIHLTAYERNKEEQVVKRFENATKRIGLTPSLISTMGGADNHQFNKNGINGIVLSCGMQKVHTTEEYIEIADLEAGADLVAELLSADLKEIT